MKMLTKYRLLGIALLVSLTMSGCVSMNVNLMTDYTDPLKEFTLEGEGQNKVLVIPINGVISDEEKEAMMRKKPSLVKEIVSQIKKAEKDPDVKAIVLKINSPGGTVTGSDILYNELIKLKTKRQIPLVVSMMDIATSGGYYISLPADHIVAHPTTITGSVGVVFVRPKLIGLMDKIGIGIETSKSGKDKDMGSPFRPTTASEAKSFQAIIDEMAELFKSKVIKHRKLDDKALEEIMTAKIYTAKQALKLGMVDQIGFADDALDKAKEMAGVENNSRVVIYRRIEFADDNIYNDLTARTGSERSLIDFKPLSTMSKINTGFYYTWPAAIK